MDAFDKMAGMLQGGDDTWKTHPKYYLFEPWDVPMRSDDLYKQAIEDGVDLFDDDLVRCVGNAPHKFQAGFILSIKFRRIVIAGNQIGKSLMVAVELLASATGEIPYSMRYPVGHDTGIPREITPENIHRWGRRDKTTGDVLDFNSKAMHTGSWDCGNVTGVGVFPQSKIVPPGSTIRLASFQRIILQNWWPAFTGAKKDQLGAFIPPQFIDRARGSHGIKGYNVQNKQVFLNRGVTLQMLTYEAGKEGFDGIKVLTFLDEEPKDEEIIGAVVLHATRWSLTETPYFGITYTKDLAFPKKVTPQAETFHASAYDCPYLPQEELDKQRETLSSTPWEIGARLWGIPTEQKGRPFYDRVKINYWLQRFHVPYKLVQFQPTQEYFGVKSDPSISDLPGLLDVPIQKIEVQEEDQKATWRIYEAPLPDVGYCNASDHAEGAETPQEAGDWSTSVIGRKSIQDPTRPVVAATLRSTLPTPQFARETLYADRYYNNAVIAPETARGASNEAFRLTVQDWPYWFKDVTRRQSTRQLREQLGFCPTHDRREALFNVLIRDWLDRYEQDEYPNIPDEWILREAAGAVVATTPSGITKCDHPPSGTIDSLFAYGILLYCFQKEYNRQIKYHGDASVDEHASWLNRMKSRERGSVPLYLGESITALR